MITEGRDDGPMVSRVENCPTRPLVPIPAPIELFSIRKTVVERGPSSMDAAVGGAQIQGFFMILGI